MFWTPRQSGSVEESVLPVSNSSRRIRPAIPPTIESRSGILCAQAQVRREHPIEEHSRAGQRGALQAHRLQPLCSRSRDVRELHRAQILAREHRGYSGLRGKGLVRSSSSARRNRNFYFFTVRGHQRHCGDSSLCEQPARVLSNERHARAFMEIVVLTHFFWKRDPTAADHLDLSNHVIRRHSLLAPVSLSSAHK